MSRKSKRIAMILLVVVMAFLAVAQHFGWIAGPPPLLAPGFSKSSWFKLAALDPRRAPRVAGVEPHSMLAGRSRDKCVPAPPLQVTIRGYGDTVA